LAASRNLEEDFSSFTLADEEVDAVVLGDLHRDFTWDRLNRLFEMLLDGAHLVALHKNRYCRRGQSLALDLGPFVAALEYASGREAIVVGKPSADFFEMALADLNLSARDVVMVGDDLEADIGGAQNAGIRAIQVETGKYRPEDQAHPSVHADVRIPSVAALPDELAHL
jgi:HAD superfamily hydrolase (TIGR01458 family)